MMVGSAETTSPRKRRPMLRKVLWSLVALLVVGCLLALWAFWVATRIPLWYLPVTKLATTEQSDQEWQVRNKMAEAQTWANHHHAWEAATSAGRTPLGKAPERELTVSFTQDEINAFVGVWYNDYGQKLIGGKERFSEVFCKPMVVIRPDCITMAGTMPMLGNRVVSLDLEPKVESGMLNLRILRIRMGDLPVPDFAWSRARADLLKSLKAIREDSQRWAKVDDSGAGNGALVTAILTQQGMDALEKKPTWNVLFIPMELGKAGLPVQLRTCELADGQITLTSQPIPRAERKGLLEAVKAGR
jgi:hypothetical protein